MRRFIGGLVVGAVVGVIIAAKAPQKYKQHSETQLANSQSARMKNGGPINLNLVSSFPNTMPVSGNNALNLIQRLREISNGKILIKLQKLRSTRPTKNLFDAVSSGTVDAALSSPQYWNNKSPAFELFSSIPFGPNLVSYLTWFRHHGGQILYEKLYARYNIHSIACGLIGVAGAGWFNHEINEAKDLRKSKIAASGLVSRVYQTLGAKTLKITPQNLLSALKSGKINAVAFSTPVTDHKLGLSKYAKIYYFPGWFQQAKFFDLMINLKTWKGLTNNQQKMIESACMANILNSMATSEGEQFNTLKKIIGEGVDVRRFSPDTIQALKRSWLSIANSEAAANKEFRLILESLRKFRNDYSIWRELGKI